MKLAAFCFALVMTLFAVGSHPALADEAAPKKKPAIAKKVPGANLKIKVTDLTTKTPKAKVKKLEKKLKAMKGVLGVTANRKKGVFKVRHTAKADPEKIRNAIKDSGFTLVAAKPLPAPETESGAPEEELDNDL